MIRSVSWCSVLLLVPAVATAADRFQPGKWVPLFNGKDLKDWTVKITGYPVGKNFGNTFRVDDGLLKVRYDKYDKFDGRFGHLFYKRPFSHYRLRVEYRFVGKQVPGGPTWAYRNSGIMIHGQTPESMRLDQKFPVSIEVQLLGGKGQGERPTANLCTPGTHVVINGKLVKQHCINSKSPTFHGDQWVTVEVEVHGSRLIRHIVNGKTVISYSQPQLDDRDPDARRLMQKFGLPRILERGTISLQSESHPIDFRRVEIMVLQD